VVHPKTYQRLLRAHSYLQKTIAAPVGLTDLAAQANLSPFHFQRAYKQAFTETPHNHRNRLRVARAKALLRSGNYSVTDVCFSIGFESVSSFSAWFSREVGLNPSRFQVYARKRKAPQEIEGVFIPSCFLRLGKS
jgi:transcriptional regulator GlxA family with amidase domain